jgi:hypothetical protein
LILWFFEKTKTILQSKTVQAINTVQCTGIYQVSKWQALCSLTGQLFAFTGQLSSHFCTSQLSTA